MYNNNQSWFGSLPPVTKNLIIINALFWLASVSLPQFTNIRLEEYLGLHFWMADKFNPAQLITYMFMHSTSSFAHLFFNMFGVFIFGRVLEYTWGSKRFLIYYMITGIGAGIIQQVAWTIDLMPFIREVNAFAAAGIEDGLKLPAGQIINSVPELLQFKNDMLNRFITVGASGSVFGLLLAFGMLFPNQPLYLMFIPVPIKAKYFVVGYAVITLFMGVANFSFDNIAHFAHLGGMIFGYFLIKHWRKNQFQQ
jgi:membrane associated rhomboid family serine protease